MLKSAQNTLECVNIHLIDPQMRQRRLNCPNIRKKILKLISLKSDLLYLQAVETKHRTWRFTDRVGSRSFFDSNFVTPGNFKGVFCQKTQRLPPAATETRFLPPSVPFPVRFSNVPFPGGFRMCPSRGDFKCALALCNFRVCTSWCGFPTR